MRLHDFLFAKANQRNIPFSGTFELLPRCNMSCKMCYVRLEKKDEEKIGKERTAQEWLKLAEECKKNGMLFLLLTGGEPFLYEDFKYLYTELKKMGFMISINTNATLLNDENLKWLIDNPPYRINITLYGASADTYEKLCGYRNGFDKAIHAIKTLHKAGIYVKLNASITPYNVIDLEKIYDIAKEINVPIQANSYMFPPVRKSEKNIGKGNRFSAEEAGKYQAKIDCLRMDREEYILRNQKFEESGIFDFEEETNECTSLDQDCFTCRAGKSSFWVTWDGRMLGCGMLNYPCAYPFKDGFFNAWKEISNQIKKITAMEKCNGCKYRVLCKACPGMVYTETGDFNKKPEYLCNIVRARIVETKRLYHDIKIEGVVNEKNNKK